MTTQEALFEVGLELAGVRLQAFTKRLLEARRTAPHAPYQELVRTAAQGIEGGALAIVADEPELRDRRLARRASSVHDAADLALYEVGRELLDIAASKW